MFRGLFFLLIASACSWAQTDIPTHPAGTSFAHFAQIDKRVYVGSKPHSDRDFEFLQSQHVRCILNARFLPFLSGVEKRKAKRYGMQFVSLPMNASPISPHRKHVDRILLTMQDPQFQPIFVHCVLGRDRTSLLSGLYKIYFLGVSKQDAWAEMRHSGFRTSWYLHGLKAYFDKYAGRPPDKR
jgi:protein tyrosine phosphatase (PTP) superfamily phosphohydrolase (DUF442 family)